MTVFVCCGDIVAIIDTMSKPVVRYYYDAWGNCKVCNTDGTENTDPNFIGNINPIRYRSYYYDVETGLYYLQSRYYDPYLGRFISPDDISYADPNSINGLNLYAYCGNNPVMYVDPTGRVKISSSIDLFTLKPKEGNYWESSQYIPKREHRPLTFKNIGYNFLCVGEAFLANSQASLGQWHKNIGSFSSDGGSAVSLGFSLFQASTNISQTERIGISVANINADFMKLDWSNGIELSAFDVGVSAVTVGYYSNDFDFEIDIGAWGLSFSFENGVLQMGASYFVGFSLKWRLW